MIEISDAVSRGFSGKEDLADLVKAYTEGPSAVQSGGAAKAGGWSDMDRASRFFETALTACTDEETIMPVVELCRRSYRDTVTVVQNAFLAGRPKGRLAS